MNALKTLKRKTGYFLTAMVTAFVFFYWTLELFLVRFEGDMLSSTIVNIIIIIIAVAFDRVEKFLYIKLKQRYKDRKPPIPMRILLLYMRGATIKSGLYLFYIFVLACMALLAAQPDIPGLSELADYFQTVYYGILILIAADKFTERLFKDIKFDYDDTPEENAPQ